MSKHNDEYPSLLDAWSTLLGMCLLLLGMAGVLYMAGHLYGYASGLAVPSFGAVCLGIILANIATTRYITRVYGVSAWRQSLRWRSTNFEQGIGVFSPTSLRNCARRIGLKPELVVVGLYALLPLDVFALVVSLVTHQISR